jgi:hypothetical protein
MSTWSVDSRCHLGKLTVGSASTERDSSWSCSQEPSTGFYSEPHEPSLHPPPVNSPPSAFTDRGFGVCSNSHRLELVILWHLAGLFGQGLGPAQSLRIHRPARHTHIRAPSVTRTHDPDIEGSGNPISLTRKMWRGGRLDLTEVYFTSHIFMWLLLDW